jgi:uncharacterized protein
MVNSVPKVIIAAISSRAYVQAAVDAGFQVIAIDAFADADTRVLAQAVIKVDLIEGQFHRQQLLRVLKSIDLQSCLGFCYGAGFEAQADLLAEIDKLLPVIGNKAQVVAHCKNPHTFFAHFDALHIPYPPTAFSRPRQTLGWLQKTIGASGGGHIKPLLPMDLADETPVYFQKKTAGMPVSCLFLADGARAQVIGFNEQWCAPDVLSPYRFGGAVSHAPLSEQVQDSLHRFVQSLTETMDLCGLNSCDCLVDGDAVFLLEINPRLSASLALYKARRGNLFQAHIDACLKRLKEWPLVENRAFAQQVIYANAPITVPQQMDWPSWVCDIPEPLGRIEQGMPICSIEATARTASLAKQKVWARAAGLLMNEE